MTSSCLRAGKILSVFVIGILGLPVSTFEITSLLYSSLALQRSEIAPSALFDELESSNDCKRLKVRSATYKVEAANSGSDATSFEEISAFVTLDFSLALIESSSEVVCEKVFFDSFVSGALSFFSSSSSSKLLRKNAAAILRRSSLAFRMAFSWNCLFSTKIENGLHLL